MITAITVAYRPYPEPIVCDFLESLRVASKQVNEVIVVYGDGGNYERTEQHGQLFIRHLSPPPRLLPWKRRNGQQFTCRYYGEHGFALKYGIDHASNDLLLLTDPDVVFYQEGFDTLYLETMEKHSLNIIGVSHYLKAPFHWDFPTVINCLVRKSNLPPPDWMKGQLKHRYGTQFHNNNGGWSFGPLTENGDDWPAVDGEYLNAGFITSRFGEYLGHNCYFNTGCNLFLWDKDKGSRSATFRCRPNGLEYMLDAIWSPLPDFDYEVFRTKLKGKTLLRHSMGFERTYEDRHRLLQFWLRESKSWMIPTM